MLRNATLRRAVAGFFLLEMVGSLAAPSLSWASSGPGQPEFTSYESAASPDMANLSMNPLTCYLSMLHVLGIKINYLRYQSYYSSNDTVTCLWQLSKSNYKQCSLTLALAVDRHEIENQYINNAPVYTRAIQYLNGDIAHDVYLHLSGQPDSLAANSATYLRQYGMTGRSTVLLTFPIPEKRLRRGCRISFRSVPLGLPARQFLFSAADLKQARRKAAATH